MAALAALGILGASAGAQTTIFTYQGRLTDAAVPANGTYEMRFELFADPTGGMPATPPLASHTIPDVPVSNGVFTVELDFGDDLFDGDARYLEITVEGAILSRRERIASTPYAIRAASANDASNLDGLRGSDYARSNDPRLSDPRAPLPGSDSYIGNTTTAQSANFAITGDGNLGGTLSAANVVAGPGSSTALCAESVMGGTGTFTTPSSPEGPLSAENANPSTSFAYGVSGRAVNALGFGFGGVFEGGARGVLGLGEGGDAATSYGVYGQASGIAGVRTGVFGEAIGTGLTTAYGVYGLASGALTNWAGYFQGNVRVTGNTGIGVNPDSGLTNTFGNTLTVSGTVRAGANNLSGCDLQFADDICLYDEQNNSLSVRSFNGLSYAPVRASGFIIASSAALKKDVTPLAHSDFQSMLDQIVGLPVFTYRYKDESESVAVHTGLIAEHSPTSLLSADGKAVDLYDFISVNAGATKALAALVSSLKDENAALKQRLEALERRLSASSMAKHIVGAGVFTVFGLVAATPALAQPYDLSWYTIDGGGVTAVTGGSYSLGATTGQRDASNPLAGGTFSLRGGFWAATLVSSDPGLAFFSVARCRVVDTRGNGAPIGGPILQGQQTRVFAVAGICGIPSTASALSINLAVTQSTAPGNVRLFPTGQPVPTVSSINYVAGQTRGNNAIVPLSATTAMYAFVGQAAGTTVQLIVDVNGYFE